MEQTFLQKVEVAINDIEKKFKKGLSSTSTKRFEKMTAIVSEFFKIKEDELQIVAAAKASNVWIRFATGRAVHQHFRLGIAILLGADAQSAISPIKTFIGKGKTRYDSIAILQRKGTGWEFSHIVCGAERAFVKLLSEEFPQIKIIVNEVSLGTRSREEFFSDLEKKFAEWLPSSGVKTEVSKYVRSIKAIGLPEIKQPIGKGGKWNGFYEYFVGEKPEKQVFEVSGLDEFIKCYGKLKEFFESETKVYGLYDKTKYDLWFDFFHAAPNKKNIKKKDQRFTLSAYKKYLLFLAEMEKKFAGSESMLPSKFSACVKSAGLAYDDNLIRRFVSALLAKPFIILTGLSGSGKTKLAESFTRWLCGCQKKIDANTGKEIGVDNVKLVSVGADWSNSEKLLGYPDALHEGQYVMPDTGILQFLRKACDDETNGVPYFLILDEMNLSHVERYFADFLSAMESVDRIVRLHDSDEVVAKAKIPKVITIPRNLFVIGTMNVDETTYMFSPKVLDRAQVIEFRVEKEEMLNYLEGSSNVDLDKLCDGDGKGLGVAYETSFITASKKNYAQIDEAKDALGQFFPILAKLGAEFGFRTASEFRRFAAIYVAAGGEPEDAVDFAIMQKLLPKLHGSRRKLEKRLKKLWNLCLKDYDQNASEEKDEELPSADIEVDYVGKCRYPVSAEKIVRMARSAQEVGFASFAEA